MFNMLPFDIRTMLTTETIIILLLPVIYVLTYLFHSLQASLFKNKVTRSIRLWHRALLGGLYMGLLNFKSMSNFGQIVINYLLTNKFIYILIAHSCKNI